MWWLCYAIKYLYEQYLLFKILYARGECPIEQYRLRPVKSGKSVRVSYARQKDVLEMPNLIEVQKDSYQWFERKP